MKRSFGNMLSFRKHAQSSMTLNMHVESCHLSPSAKVHVSTNELSNPLTAGYTEIQKMTASLLD